MNAMPAVIIVRFENKHRSIPSDELEEINLFSFARGLSIGNTPRPGYRTTYRFLFASSEPTLTFLVREHLKHRFLVHDFASERIHETNVVVHICADERVRIVIAREEFVNDHPLVNEIDAKRAAPQLPLLILEVVRRTYDSGNAVRAEMLLQKNELTRRRQVLPIQDRNVRHAGGAPFAVSTQQRFEQSFDWGELT